MVETVRQILSVVTEWISDNWFKALSLAAIAVVTAIWARYQASRAWRRRQFLKRVNLSLNFLDGDMLRFRTLFELELDSILLGNSAAVRIVLRAARRTRPGQPIMEFPPDEAWHIMNSVLNEISERFAHGTLAAAVGVPVVRRQFVFAMTCEKDKDVRWMKIRIMLIAENLLERIASSAIPKPNFEAPHHSIRWNTLNTIAACYKTERQSGFRKLMRI
jgi:hypothetical protein